MIYLASSIFTQAEQDFGFALTARLEDAGHQVYFPWRDAGDDELFERFAGDWPKISHEIVVRNLAAVQRAGRVVAVCEGADVECGTAMEVGYAHALGKPIVCLRTDFRTQGERIGPVNIMINDIAEAVHPTVDALIAGLAEPAPEIHVEDLSAFYDQVAREYSDAEEHGFTARCKQAESTHSRAVLAGRRFGTAVDLACGAGGFLGWVDAERKIGVDASAGMLTVHRELLPGASYVLSDATRTPLPAASAGVVHCAFLLDHLEDPTALLDEARRLLAPGGVFLLAYHEGESLVRWRGEPRAFRYTSRTGKVYRVPSDPAVLAGLRSAIEQRFTVRDYARLPVPGEPVAIEHYVLEAS